MGGGGLWDLNCEVCGENDESGIADIGVDCVVEVVSGDVCMFSSCTTKVDFLFLLYKIFGDGGVEAVVVLTSVGTLVGPADVWDLGGYVIVGSDVGLVVVGSGVVVLSVVWVATVVLSAVALSTEVLAAVVFSLDGGCLTCLAGIFFLFEDPTSSTSCCCSLFKIGRAH